ncbi:DUF4175 domain-containing protein [Engelhardtia mirabilis]|uniref:DUF4175 domain-containing protein n=1 Tax=Engelhardtia mirabilis TaxID=2528011 RepID=UPI0011A3C0D6
MWITIAVELLFVVWLNTSVLLDRDVGWAFPALFWSVIVQMALVVGGFLLLPLAGLTSELALLRIGGVAMLSGVVSWWLTFGLNVELFVD